ncbi:hypothetical protein HYQ46_011764 [Verticillium longisporum]|nr:hypothetical protein HYQ44_004391 [Verticillium longisporum]KAG7152397.1 hypothetical protein HYQ46_011764 [Verticillium longisporum]
MARYGAKTHLKSGAQRSLFSPVGAFKPAMKFLEARDKDNKTGTDKWRPVVKGMLTVAEEEEKEKVMTPIKTSMVSETLSRRRLAVPLLWGSLIASGIDAWKYSYLSGLHTPPNGVIDQYTRDTAWIG